MKHNILALLFALLLPVAHFACTCIGESTVKQSKKEVAAVFSGTVLSSERVELIDSTVYDSSSYDTIPHHFSHKAYIMKFVLLVEDFYKGKLKQDTLLVYTGMGGGDCGYRFQVGKKYIVYGRDETYFGMINNSFQWPEGKGVFWTQICLRTGLWNEEEHQALGGS